jgi:hypothetical protein
MRTRTPPESKTAARGVLNVPAQEGVGLLARAFCSGHTERGARADVAAAAVRVARHVDAAREAGERRLFLSAQDWRAGLEPGEHFGMPHGTYARARAAADGVAASDGGGRERKRSASMTAEAGAAAARGF